jgi:glycosyltransferase involved in cell wall biosynthesis
MQVFIPALRLCREHGLEVRLSVAGDGPLRDELPAFYRSVDVVAVPSLSEALGNVTHEALAAGRPIVTTRTGAAEIAERASIVVEKGSSEAIAEALMTLAGAPPLRAELSRNARAIGESMSWKQTARRYVHILK